MYAPLPHPSLQNKHQAYYGASRWKCSELVVPPTVVLPTSVPLTVVLHTYIVLLLRAVPRVQLQSWSLPERRNGKQVKDATAPTWTSGRCQHKVQELGSNGSTVHATKWGSSEAPSYHMSIRLSGCPSASITIP
jgi:hypothetical protein